MSGGSWDYVYCRFNELSDRLTESRSPLRRALGNHLALVADAMKAIEWVDSSDWGQGDDIEPIKKVLEDCDGTGELRVLLEDASDILERLEEIRAEIKYRGR